MPKESTIFGKPFLRFTFSQYYKNDLPKTQQPDTPLKIAFCVTKSQCRLNYRSILGKWSPLCPQEKEDQRQGSCQTDLQFLQMRIVCCMGKETKMWNVNLQLLLHLWIQLQSLEAWKRTMSISVTKWRWPYQVLKARLHSFHQQYKPWRFTKLCNRTSRMTRLLLWLNKLLVFIFHASLMSITTSPYNFKLFFPKIMKFNKELTRKNTSSSEISQFV